MGSRRITISVPAAVAARIKKAAGRTPVSAWVTDVIEEHLDDAELERMWRELYASVRPRAADVKRADEIFGRITRARRRKSVA